MKRIAALLTSIALLLTTIGFAGTAKAEVKSKSGNLSVAKPTVEQIRDAWNSIPEITSIYASQPSVTPPYAAGSLSASHIANSEAYLNYIRYISGLPETRANAALNDSAQHGAVVLAALGGGLSHFPDRPSGMDDAFYQAGSEACSSSNIGAGYDTVSKSLRGYMDDNSSTSNLSCLGHRRWLLNPTLLNVGFGLAKNNASNYKYYTVTRVFDRSGAGCDYDFISWPPSGNCPTNVFDTTTPWSITLNPNKFSVNNLSGVRVTITRRSDGAAWTLDRNNPISGNFDIDKGAYFCTDSGGYGVSNCIIFRPNANAVGTSQPDYSGIGPYDCGIYNVHVEGLKSKTGAAVTIDYDVNFFDINSVSLPGDVDGDGKITMMDAALAARMALNLITANLAADIDGNGAVTMTDAAMIARRALNVG